MTLLTGLGNRKKFHEALNQSLSWANNNNQLIALMFLDLDGFKQVNDTLGHDTGDQLLKVVAQRLTNSLRNTDIVSRLGGDEFTVILPGIPQADYAAKVAEKILKSLSQAFVLEGKTAIVTVSIGISIYPKDGEVEDILIKKSRLSHVSCQTTRSQSTSIRQFLLNNQITLVEIFSISLHHARKIGISAWGIRSFLIIAS